MSGPVPQPSPVEDESIIDSLMRGAAVGQTCVALSEDAQRILLGMVQPLSASEIHDLKTTIESGKVRLEHQFFQLPTYPLFVLRATIMDRPSNPFWLETYPNIGGQGRDVLNCLRQGGQLGIHFHFYDSGGTSLFRAGYSTLLLPDRTLGTNIVKAQAILASLGPLDLDYPRAVQQYLRENS